jgi:hypothetical protein
VLLTSQVLEVVSVMVCVFWMTNVLPVPKPEASDPVPSRAVFQFDAVLTERFPFE